MAGEESWNSERAAAIISEYRDQDGPLLPILHALQHEFGYIDKAAEPVIAEALNVSRAEVHGVVTFYHDFREHPAGCHVLKICRAEACQAAGGDGLAARAEQLLSIPIGGTTADGRVTLEAVYCLGLCSVSPSAMLDGKIHARLDNKKLDALIAQADR